MVVMILLLDSYSKWNEKFIYIRISIYHHNLILISHIFPILLIIMNRYLAFHLMLGSALKAFEGNHHVLLVFHLHELDANIADNHPY